MKKYKAYISLILFCLCQSAWAIDGNMLLKKLDDVLFPNKYAMKLTMINKKPDGAKYIYEMSSIGIRDLSSLMVFMAPKREVGKKILMKDNNLWLVTPNISHPVKLSKKESFMGSTFSNNDLMDVTLANDYTAVVLGTEKLNEKECYVVEAKAKPEAKERRVISYDKLKVWVTQEDFIALKMEYYARSGRLIKTLKLDQVKLLAGSKRPSRLTMESQIQKGAVTQIKVDKLVAQPGLKPSQFSMKNL